MKTMAALLRERQKLQARNRRLRRQLAAMPKPKQTGAEVVEQSFYRAFKPTPKTP